MNRHFGRVNLVTFFRLGQLGFGLTQVKCLAKYSCRCSCWYAGFGVVDTNVRCRAYARESGDSCTSFVGVAATCTAVTMETESARKGKGQGKMEVPDSDNHAKKGAGMERGEQPRAALTANGIYSHKRRNNIGEKLFAV